MGLKRSQERIFTLRQPDGYFVIDLLDATGPVAIHDKFTFSELVHVGQLVGRYKPYRVVFIPLLGESGGIEHGYGNQGVSVKSTRVASPLGFRLVLWQ